MRLERQAEATLCRNLKSVVESLDFILNALKDMKQGSNIGRLQSMGSQRVGHD